MITDYLDDQVDFFFAPPLPEQTGPARSILHLLRREMQDCLIGTVVPENEFIAYPGERRRLFATLLVIMCGIDLLAKFHAGDDAGNAGGRFKAFASAFIFPGHPSAVEYAEALWCDCRNPVVHSFNVRKKKYQINIIDKSPGEAMWHRGDRYVVSVEGLAQAFIKAIESYEAKVRANSQLQVKFHNMFFRYGDIGVQTTIAGKVTS